MDSERLRIAVFSDSALPILNGVSISIQSLNAELRNAGHSVVLFTAGHPGHRDDDPHTYRFRALETPWATNYPLAIPPFTPRLRDFRSHEFDVIHTHTPFTVGMVGLRWAESHEIPIVSTYHTLYDRYSHYIPYFPHRYVRFKIAKHTNFYYSRVAHAITPSDAAAKWLRRHAVETPITVIPTGTQRRAFFERAEERTKLGIPSDQTILLYVGRIAREKSLPTLLEAVAQVFREIPTARLWLVGDGPYRTECAEIVRRLGIGDRVRFVGFVPRDEVDRFYAASDLFVFSSITETQGLVVQEAMQYGLPAVVSIGGGAGASIVDGMNGFLVKHDSEALADSILKVLRDPILHARLSEGASRSVQAYTSAEMAKRVVGVYRQVIQQPARDREGSHV